MTQLPDILHFQASQTWQTSPRSWPRPLDRRAGLMEITGHFLSWETEGSVLFALPPLPQGILLQMLSEALPSGTERDGAHDKTAAPMSSQKVLLRPPLGHIGRLFICHTDCPSLNGKRHGGSVARTHGFLQVDCVMGGTTAVRLIQISAAPCLTPPGRHAAVELLGSPPPTWRGVLFTCTVLIE